MLGNLTSSKGGIILVALVLEVFHIFSADLITSMLRLSKQFCSNRIKNGTCSCPDFRNS